MPRHPAASAPQTSCPCSSSVSFCFPLFLLRPLPTRSFFFVVFFFLFFAPSRRKKPVASRPRALVDAQIAPGPGRHSQATPPHSLASTPACSSAALPAVTSAVSSLAGPDQIGRAGSEGPQEGGAMGNANGKEEGESGNDEPSVRSDGDARSNGDCAPRRAGSAESMGNTPPGSPGRSRSPVMFAPQIPVAPLHQAADTPVFSPSRMDDSCGSFLPPEKGIPTMITWNSGGNEVAVEGSWDNWTSRRILQRSGNDHSLLLVLPSGIYQYKFIVDGEWRHIPDLPHIADERGQVVNLLDVHDFVPENVDGVADFEAPPSPDSSYGQPFPVDEDFAKEPPLVPPQLHLTVLGAHNEEASTKPQHVVLNHLFIEKGWASQSLVALGLTHRFQSKYVTVVLYKPLTR